MERASTALNNIDAFVNMMSAATGVPEWKLESWLDIYFNLRVIKCLEDEEATEQCSEAASCVKQPETAGEASPSPTEEVRHPGGDFVLNYRTPEIASAVESIHEFEPEKKLSGNGARFKREILGRLTAARASGTTIANIVAASHGGLKEDEIIQALNCQHLHHSKWTAIGAALESLDF